MLFLPLPCVKSFGTVEVITLLQCVRPRRVRRNVSPYVLFLFFLQRIRDEAHRFAITYHRNLRQKKSNKSKLDLIEGIGLKRRKALISHFKSVEKIKKSSVEEISKINNINKTLAEQILRELNSK